MPAFDGFLSTYIACQTCNSTMVYKHNMLPFDFHLAFERTSQLDCGGQFTSSAFGHILEKRHLQDEARSAGEQEFGNVIAVTSTDNTALDNLSWVISNNGEPVSSDNSKRPLGDDENPQIVAKHARQTDVTASDEFMGNSCLQEDIRLDPLVRLSFLPEYFDDHHGPIEYNQVEEAPSFVCNYLQRKLVAVGPDHQAEIPVWRTKNFRNSPGASTSSVRVTREEDSSDKWIAHCITPTPVSNSSGCKADCHCLDKWSIRCVRLHVIEAREELRSNLGHEQFVELGLCEMGEDAALGWTEEEGQLFSKVVMGKNFWDDLPRVFPSRSKRELVSYYFNVFVLRKRAEQNRSDPMNVDSDNDEWQEFEDDEDDSGVESPTNDNDAYREGEVNSHGEAEGDECDDDSNDECGTCDEFVSKSNFGAAVHDVHDDSCTSYEGPHSGPGYYDGGRVDVFEGDQWNLHAHDLVVGHCDLKPWDIGYNDLELLPTSNVIEEVFGNESWESKRDGDGVC